VQRWCRIIPAPFNKKNAKDLLDELDIKIEPYEVVKSPEDDEGLLLIFKDTVHRLTTGVNDLLQMFKKSYQFERRLQDWGYQIQHCTESEARGHLTSGSFEAALFLPKIRKEQVIGVALEKQIFTPKATRHRLPARPVSVNVPLSILRDKDSSIEEANRKLADHLRKREIKRYESGAKWMGRIYDEVLYVFSDL
jgi:hypothetical protein